MTFAAEHLTQERTWWRSFTASMNVPTAAKPCAIGTRSDRDDQTEESSPA
jgi:hypothetical protein